MPRPFTLLVAAPLLLSVLLQGCITLPSAESPRSKVEKTWRAHIDAARNKDAATIGHIYADDIVYVVNGEEVRGRAAIDAHETASLASGDVIDVEHETRDLLVDEDLAYEVGTISGNVRTQNAASSFVTFHFMARWRKGEDRVWRIEYIVGDFERP